MALLGEVVDLESLQALLHPVCPLLHMLTFSDVSSCCQACDLLPRLPTMKDSCPSGIVGPNKSFLPYDAMAIVFVL